MWGTEYHQVRGPTTVCSLGSPSALQVGKGGASVTYCPEGVHTSFGEECHISPTVSAGEKKVCNAVNFIFFRNTMKN